VPPFAEGLARVRLWAPDGTGRWLLVDVAAQRLHLMNEAVPLDSWPVSTAAAGLDARDGSGGTPPGAHRISRRIGDQAPRGMVFVSREPTGRLWPHDTDFEGRGKDCGADQAEDLILTRILTLDGLEGGVNRGPGVDSGERYIYIHGTNAETRLGTPCSHGCVRLGNADVMALFDLVREGDPVVII
jgi:UDP-N-acetylmuramate--alanine ligase